MYFRLLIIVVILCSLYWLAKWFIRTPPKQVAKRVKQSTLIVVAALLMVMALTGKLHWLFGLLAGLMPFAQRLLALLRGYQMFKNMAGQFQKKSTTAPPQSTITTALLKMTLDHDSGELSGIVLDGQFRGQQLNDMPLDTLTTLLADCRVQDEESTTLLETYLDRRFGEQWREQFEQPPGSQSTHQYQSDSGNMTVNEAYEVLGLSANASAEDIKTAHKRLIQKLHPDRGGSAYLATKINKAKEILMDHLQSNG